MTAAAADAAAMRRFRARAVIVDLDGTLLDTAVELTAAANAMRAGLGLPPLPQRRIEQFVGKGVDALVHRALTDDLDGRLDPEGFERGRSAFLRHYSLENGRSARPYPGAIEGLQAMRAKRFRLACVTNKPREFTEPLLRRCGVSRYFDLVVSGDTTARKKPDPQPMLHVAECFGLPAQQVVAIGDSMNDVLAARAAGMPVLAVPYGYNEGRDPFTLDADGIVASLLDAAALIDIIEPAGP